MERIVLFVFTAFLLSGTGVAADSNLVFNVQHRYGGRGKSTPAALKAHDANRHGRFLAAIDLPLGGDGQISGSGLYFTKLAIGSPAKDFFVQVDTGSDILWVNCVGCAACPKESKLGFEMNLYDLKASSTGKQIGCNDDMCNVIYNNQSSCKEPSKPCEYHISYADGSQMSGFFVTDTVHFDQATTGKTGDLDGKITFGCSGKQGGTQGTSTDNVSGIVGLGQGNSSIISQLAAAKKSKKMFAHCLDSVNGGGIFAIGQVVDPKFNTTPMSESTQHYYVTMMKAEVNGEVFEIPTESFFDYGRQAVIDSGATLAHLPNDVYDLIMPKITAKHPKLKTYVVDPDLKCFEFDGKVDDSFPAITFHFDKSAALTVYPHDYLLHLRDGNNWCFGFQRGGMPMPDGGDLILLGDLIISNKLVVYDLEKRTIGWAQHNCSASIKVKDETAGSVNAVGNHTISSTGDKSSAGQAWSAVNVLTAVLISVVTAQLIV